VIAGEASLLGDDDGDGTFLRDSLHLSDDFCLRMMHGLNLSCSLEKFLFSET
jgi:hypothetical protein